MKFTLALRSPRLSVPAALLLPLALLVNWPGLARAAQAQPPEPGEPSAAPAEPPAPLVVRKWTVSRALIRKGQSVTVRVIFLNQSGGTLTGVRLEGRPDEGLELVREEVAQSRDLAPEEEIRGLWEVRSDRTELYQFHVSATAAGGESQQLDIPIAVTRMPAPPPRDEASRPRVRWWGDQKDLLFENKWFSALLVKNSYGYGPLLLYPNHPQQRPRPPLLIAVMTPLSRVVWRESGGRLRIADFYPQKVRLINGIPKLHLEASAKEGDQEWQFGTDLEIQKEPWIDTDYELKAVQSANVVHFAGPALRIGEGADGAADREAVFPGLEFLERDEESSSDRFDDTANHLRLAPNPYKITVPAIGISQQNTLVALLWQPGQEWAPEARLPSAVFDSPNRWENQDNHLMGLFAPGIPEHVPENQTLARNPYRLAGDESLLLRSKVAVLPDERDPAQAIRLWARAYGLPDRPDPPHGFDAQRAISREAYTDTLWQPDLPGWNHALPAEKYAPQSYQGPVVALLVDGQLTGGPTGEGLREQAEEVIAALRRPVTDPEGRQVEAAPFEPRLAYRAGGVIRSLEAARVQVAELMATQNLSGAWRWQPLQPEEGPLGEAGSTELGVISSRALPVLRFAAVTGDTAALAAGMQALVTMERFRVPRGGQIWELPLGTPDLLAAAQAAEAYALAYRLTERPEFLRYARRWADAGLAFIYFWREEGRNEMSFASVPAFGASFFERSWIGTARQWVGLTYGRVLRMLHELQEDPVYDRVSSGILISAQYQQYTNEDRAGLYPDSYDIVENEPDGPYLNPELLLGLLYANEGYEMDLDSERARIGSDRVYVTSPYKITKVTASVTRLNFRVHANVDQGGIGGKKLPPPGEEVEPEAPEGPLELAYDEAFITIHGFDEKPIAVRFNGDRLPEADEEEEEGWYWDEARNMVLIRWHFTDEDEDEIEVRMRQPVRSPRERELEVPYATRGRKVK